MDETHSTVSQPVIKVLSVWAALGITTWADAAASVAFFYTVLLIVEWFWKRFWKPVLTRYGVLKETRNAKPDPGDSTFQPERHSD